MANYENVPVDIITEIIRIKTIVTISLLLFITNSPFYFSFFN